MKSKAKYYIGDSRNLRKLFIRRKIPNPNLIISSPPYFDLLDYEGTAAQIGYGQSDYEKYLSDVSTVFQDCYEVSKPNATFWLIIDTFKKNGELKLLPFDIYRKLKEQNKTTWKLKDIIIWDKEKNLPWNSKGKLKNQFEYILFFTKGNNYKFEFDKVREINDLKKWWLSYPERYNPKGKAPSNVWQHINPLRGWGYGNQNHFCPIPFSLAEKIISISSLKGYTIFDPFAGSGSTIALAAEMGRKAYGIDINQSYKKTFLKEVIKGARNYWKKKSNELKDNKAAIQTFSSTNSKLRKLKVAATIAKHLNKINNSSFVYLLIDRNKENFDLYVVENGIRPVANISDEIIKNLLKQAKVNPNICIIKDVELNSKITLKKLNRYPIEKFYSLTDIVNCDTLLKNKSKYNFLHSNIYLKVNKY